MNEIKVDSNTAVGNWMQWLFYNERHTVMPTTHHIRTYFLLEQLKRDREKKTSILSPRSKSNISVDTSRVPIVRLLLFLFLSLSLPTCFPLSLSRRSVECSWSDFSHRSTCVMHLNFKCRFDWSFLNQRLNKDTKVLQAKNGWKSLCPQRTVLRRRRIISHFWERFHRCDSESRYGDFSQCLQKLQLLLFVRSFVPSFLIDGIVHWDTAALIGRRF